MLDVNEKELVRREPRLVEILVRHMDKSSPRVQSQAATVLGTLACDGECQLPHPVISCSRPTADNRQLELIKANGLNPLLRLLQSPDPGSIFAAASCVWNLTDKPTNGPLVIKAGFLQPLVNLLAFKDNRTAQFYAAGALCRLATNAENSRRAIVDAGTVQSIKELVVEASVGIQIEMTGCIRNLSSSGMHSPFNCLFESHRP